jgi:hypothetical protein
MPVLREEDRSAQVAEVMRLADDVASWLANTRANSRGVKYHMTDKAADAHVKAAERGHDRARAELEAAVKRLAGV